MISEIAEQLRTKLDPSDATVTEADDDRVAVASTSPGKGLRIEIWERDPADLQVAIFVPEKRENPFEAIFIGSTAEEQEVAADAVRLVCDLVAERAVLGWDSGFWRGGRRFIKVGELSEARRSLSWIVSWRGTYDWNSSAV